MKSPDELNALLMLYPRVIIALAVHKVTSRLCVPCARCFPSRRRTVALSPAMQEDLREVLAWHANCCGAALVGRVYKVWTFV